MTLSSEIDVTRIYILRLNSVSKLGTEFIAESDYVAQVFNRALCDMSNQMERPFTKLDAQANDLMYGFESRSLVQYDRLGEDGRVIEVNVESPCSGDRLHPLEILNTLSATRSITIS